MPQPVSSSARSSNPGKQHERERNIQQLVSRRVLGLPMLNSKNPSNPRFTISKNHSHLITMIYILPGEAKNNEIGNSLFRTAARFMPHPAGRAVQGSISECPSGTPVYAPCDSTTFYVTDSTISSIRKSSPAGSALEKFNTASAIRTPDNVDTMATLILWHMHAKETPVFPMQFPRLIESPQVKAGQLSVSPTTPVIRSKRNSGHLRLRYMPCDETGETSDPENGLRGCI